MKKSGLILLLLALLPVVAGAQADKKLINKAQDGDAEAMIRLGRYYENGAGVAHDSTIALKWFQKAADLGNGNAWAEIAPYYLHGGAGLTADTARYFAIAKEWAGKGFPDAMSLLGVAYEYGLGCKADTAKAVECYQQSAKAGSASGLYHLGIAQMYGDLGLAQNAKQGLANLEKSAKQGRVDAYAMIAQYYLGTDDFKKAQKYISEGVRQGDPYTTTVQARAYFYGQGVATNEALALRILDSVIREYHNMPVAQEMAATYRLFPDDVTLRDTAMALRILQDGDDLDFSSCQMQLANYYAQQGQFELAYQYAKKVADKKVYDGYQADACMALADLAYSGRGCPQSSDEAIAWLKQAADRYQSDVAAMQLANLYLDEEYRNVPEAINYFRAADRYGNTEAMASLGELYANTGNAELATECFQTMIDRKQPDGYYYLAMQYDANGDAKKCNELLAKGDKQGSRMAAESLGIIYENGLDGYKVDYKKAEKYYERAASAKSLYRIGIMYVDGMLGKMNDKDIAKGLDYINRSADMGYTEAIYALGYCYETGRKVDTVDLARAFQYYKLLADNELPAGQYKVGCIYMNGGDFMKADTAKAFEYIQKAADADYPAAKCDLGECYRQGLGVAVDSAKAFDYYESAHNLGYATGTFLVGRSYLEGCGVDVDTAKAIPYLKNAAYRGVGDAAYQIAEMYYYGRGGLESEADSAIAYYIKGHEYGSGEASNYIGQQLLEEGYYDKATDYLFEGMRRGNVDAAITFAMCRQQGIGFDDGANPEVAYEIFESVIHEYGPNARAYTELGVACIKGLGCPADEALGKSYFDTAANMGNLLAMHNLGQCYLNGIGCRIDTAQAIRWLERAADNESIKAINALGDVYEAQGDFKNAVLYYEKGMAMGSLESYCNLGYCYEQGQGVVLNSQKAYELYKYAADQGYNRGYMCLANCYLNGIYVQEDAAEALVWLTKAAEEGNVMAMYYCGSILEDGEGNVAADRKKAKEWYKQAAAAGFDPAAAALGRMK